LWHGVSIVAGKRTGGPAVRATNPANRRETIGEVQHAQPENVERAFAVAHDAQREWDAVPASERARILERAADLYEAHMPELLAYCVREAGRTIADSVAEVREAIDFLRYYASRARAEFDQGLRLPGPTGESNELWLREIGRAH